ncbi:DUF2335 domain-containing protein [Desulfobacca acetoxidans]|uniref:DUF2335 domain-containing protein n=1 Tax=Desulfobacca acetoxidans (strain ATCC 700848 / DSM 11109 / ASRB2) TaxID=880072 RepID=F2NG82_DESAR|nr:DUF2335 domain-containing protein [Desulfobacca acetoxidans]AEB08495.1 Protein of unknown function DUF2335, membrane [Desulfobacca acetoxidans DSM 11109]
MPKNRQNKKNKGDLSSCSPLPSSSPSPNNLQFLSAARSAPLPLPSELEAYESILPGAAQRIFLMAEAQSNHRQRLEVKALSIEGRNSLLGILAGWFLGTLGLLTSGLCIYSGHDAAGATIGGISLASLVGTFIYGTRERRLEREHKYLAFQNQRKSQKK